MPNPNPNQEGLIKWKAGQSGNPKGRPRKSQEQRDAEAKFKELKDKKGNFALQQLIKIGEAWANGKLDARALSPVVAALKHVDERFHGKPRQALEHDMEIGGGSVIVKVLGTDELDNSGSD